MEYGDDKIYRADFSASGVRSRQAGYWKSRNKEEEEKAKAAEDRYKQFVKNNESSYMEDGTLAVGDSFYQDNQDGTFTDSAGKKVSMDSIKATIQKNKEAADAEVKKKEEDSGGWNSVENFAQGLAAGAWKGASGALGSAASLVSSAIAGDADNAVTDATKKWQKSADEWGDEVNANGVSEFIGNLPGGIVGGIVDPASYMVRGVRNTPEMIAASIAAGSGDEHVRKAGIESQKELQKRQFGDDVAENGDGAMLMEGISKPGEAILNVATGGTAAALKETGKQGAKDVFKEVAKQGGINVAAGVPLSTMEQAARGQEITAGSIAQDALIQGATGGVLGGVGKYSAVKKGNKAIDEADAAKVAADADSARIENEKATFQRIREQQTQDILDKQKAKDLETSEANYRDHLTKVDESRMKMLEATNPRDDTPASNLADGSVIVPEGQRYQRKNNLRLKEIDKQLSAFNRSESKLSGENAKALADERKSIIDDINSQYDTRTNTGKTVDAVDDELVEIASGNIPEDARMPARVVEDPADIQKVHGIPEDTKAYHLEIERDRQTIDGALEPLMTQERFNELANTLDADYNARVAAIEAMPPRRQEAEMAKLNEEYEGALNALTDSRDNDAPQVAEFTRMREFLDTKEAELVNSINVRILEDPKSVYFADEARLNGKVDQLVKEKEIAEVTENTSSVSSPIVGSVQNGVKPTDNTNPRVVKALDDDKVARDNAVRVTDKVGLVSYLTGAPSRVLRSMGKIGEKIDNVLTEATNAAYIGDQQVALQVSKWNKMAGRKEGMRQVAKALDGDIDSFSNLNEGQRQVFNEVRDWFKDYADRLGLPENARIDDYLPHIMDGKSPDKLDMAAMQLATGKNLDGTPLTNKQFNEANEIVKGVDYDTLEMIRRNSRFKMSKNGFLEKRTGAEGYSFDLADIINSYAHSAHRTMYIDPAIAEVKTLSPGLSNGQNEYLGSLIDRIKDVDSAKIDQQLNATLSKIPFLGDKAFSRSSTFTRKLIYDALLGANPASAIRNISQGANTYAKLGNKYTAHGMKMAGASFGKSNEAFDELLRNGVLTNRFSDLRDGGKLDSARSGLDKGLWTMFSSVEQFNRATAYFGAKQRYIDKFVKAAEKKGQKLDPDNLPDDVIKAAEHAGREMSRKTQFEFGVMDVPIGQTSQFAKNAIQFQSFNLAQVKFLKDMIHGDTDSLFVKGTDGKTRLSAEGVYQIARYVGAQAVFIGTVGSLIGMEFNDMIPYYDEVDSIRTGKETSVGAIPISPMGKLLGFDSRSKGVLDVLGAAAGVTEEGGLKNLGDTSAAFTKNAAATLFPAGTQIKKSLEGATSVATGESKNPEGKTRFIQDQDPLNATKATLFGQYNTPSGRNWVSEGFPTFSEKQSEKIGEQETMNAKQRYADAYKLGRGRDKVLEKAKKAAEDQGKNASFRIVQEWNKEQDAAIAEYRKKHPGALPQEIANILNDSKIIFNNQGFAK